MKPTIVPHLLQPDSFASPITEVPTPRGEMNEVEELDMAYLATFSGGRGKMVLEDLISRTMGQPTFSANLGLLEGIAHGFAREGQNALVAEILRRMERAKKRKEK